MLHRIGNETLQLRTRPEPPLGQNDCENLVSSFAVALNCRIGPSSLNAEVNAFDRLQIVRARVFKSLTHSN